MSVMTRREAMAHGLARYFTGKPCKNGHMTERRTACYNCAACSLERSTQWRMEHPAAAKAVRQKWLVANPAGQRLAGKKYLQNNKERVAARQAAYRSIHKERQRITGAIWVTKNRAKVNGYSAHRRAAAMLATPIWANQFCIEEAYDLARRREVATGIEWHVDHIVPLRSRLVCGLHVEHNLRVIPGVENIRKGNRHWPDMP